ncbi:hypothetical protein GCM10010307_51320 [Streptomyces vastus]|uniref:Uncharacterized protein n=1 Tax=Streptomyces vastus TaxID=285451 RepID=A0ABP6DIA3_9ACTN
MYPEPHTLASDACEAADACGAASPKAAIATAATVAHMVDLLKMDIGIPLLSACCLHIND